jgi:hypothetical protein
MRLPPGGRIGPHDVEDLSVAVSLRDKPAMASEMLVIHRLE